MKQITVLPQDPLFEINNLMAQCDQLAEALRELIYAHEAGEVTRDDWVKARKVLAARTRVATE